MSVSHLAYMRGLVSGDRAAETERAMAQRTGRTIVAMLRQRALWRRLETCDGGRLAYQSGSPEPDLCVEEAAAGATDHHRRRRGTRAGAED